MPPFRMTPQAPQSALPIPSSPSGFTWSPTRCPWGGHGESNPERSPRAGNSGLAGRLHAVAGTHTDKSRGRRVRRQHGVGKTQVVAALRRADWAHRAQSLRADPTKNPAGGDPRGFEVSSKTDDHPGGALELAIGANTAEGSTRRHIPCPYVRCHRPSRSPSSMFFINPANTFFDSLTCQKPVAGPAIDHSTAPRPSVVGSIQQEYAKSRNSAECRPGSRLPPHDPNSGSGLAAPSRYSSNSTSGNCDDSSSTIAGESGAASSSPGAFPLPRRRPGGRLPARTSSSNVRLRRRSL